MDVVEGRPESEISGYNYVAEATNAGQTTDNREWRSIIRDDDVLSLGTTGHARRASQRLPRLGYDSFLDFMHRCMIPRTSFDSGLWGKVVKGFESA